MSEFGNMVQTSLAQGIKTIKPNKPDNKVSKSYTPSFTGLSSTLERTIYASPVLLQKMAGVSIRGHQHALVGNLPGEMISFIRKNTRNPVELAKQVKNIHSGFATMASALRQVELESVERAKVVCKDVTFIEKYIEYKKKVVMGGGNAEELSNLLKEINDAFLPSKEVLAELEKQSAQVIETSMKKAGVIPQNASIQVNYIGQGSFGSAYKVSFLNYEGSKLFHDKVLKIYKDPVITNEINGILTVGTQKHYMGMTKKQYIAKMSEVIDKDPGVAETTRNELRKFFGNCYEQMLKTPESELIKFANIMTVFPQHGVEAEANAAAFVKKAIGHKLEKSDLVQPYFIDLDANISLAEMSDDTLAAITKQTDFRRLGLFHSDIDGNLGNTVAGRIVDYGGIQVGNDVLVNIKAARRVYKKISALEFKSPELTAKSRIDLWNRYYDLAINNKISQSSDVLEGLKEAKSLIDKSQLSKLHDYRSKHFK